MIQCEGGDGSGQPPIPAHLTRQVKLARWAQTLQNTLLNGEYENSAMIVDCLRCYLNDEIPLAEAIEERLRCRAARQALRDLSDTGKTIKDVPEDVQDLLIEAIEKGRDHA